MNVYNIVLGGMYTHIFNSVAFDADLSYFNKKGKKFSVITGMNESIEKSKCTHCTIHIPSDSLMLILRVYHPKLEK